jgi:hypothetical protein
MPGEVGNAAQLRERAYLYALKFVGRLTGHLNSTATSPE